MQISPSKSNFGPLSPLGPGLFLQSEGILSDSKGIRSVTSTSANIAQDLELDVAVSDSVFRGFGDDRVNRTVESGIELLLKREDHYHNSWLTRISSLLSRQDIDQFAREVTMDRLQHRTYSLSQGWRRQFAQGFSLELFAGVARCIQGNDSQARTFALGGIHLKKEFPFGDFSALLSHDVQGGGAYTGIYGSQLLKKVQVNGRIRLVRGVVVQFECGISVTHGAFEAQEMLRKAPVLSASASIEYQLASNLKGSVGYVHRTLIGATEAVHGFEGPMATAALSYNIF